MSKIACIDDNISNLEYVALILGNDYQVDLYEQPLDFFKNCTNTNYAAIIIDIHMPKMDGFNLYENILAHPFYNGCPVLFISSDDTEIARIRSFSLGAVDFLNRRLNPEEFRARVKSKISFFEKYRTVLEFADLKLNLTLLKAHIAHEELRLTFTEFKLLTYLVKNFPDYLSKEDLVEKVWGAGVVLDATLYTHISNLNAKILKWDYEISMERNKGLLLNKRQ